MIGGGERTHPVKKIRSIMQGKVRSAPPAGQKQPNADQETAQQE
jgi:hypothetical protein